MDGESFKRLREALGCIEADAQYYALTLTADENGKIRWSSQSKWVGEGSKAMWEMRAPSLVHPQRMRAAWKAIGQTSIVVNNLETLGFFLRAGGNALVKQAIAQRWLPAVLEPVECVPGPLFSRPRLRATVPVTSLKRAPNKKLRMDVLRRDDFRCRICGRRADDHVDIELHVHHIRPHGKGGLTEDDNLITLCHTCHIGLDPHFEPRLLGMLPGGVPMGTIDIDQDRDEYEEGVRLYRQVSALAAQAALAARRGRSSGSPGVDVTDQP